MHDIDNCSMGTSDAENIREMLRNFTVLREWSLWEYRLLIPVATAADAVKSCYLL